MMRLSLRMACVLVTASFMVVGPAFSAQYYVRTNGNNSNTGLADTAGGAWLTIEKAVDTMVAGDTATVDDGTYVEGSMRFVTSGTAGNPITLRAKNKHLAILSSTSGCAGNIETTASYITIDGIRTQIDAGNVACGGGHNSTDGDGVRCFTGTGGDIGGPVATQYNNIIVRNTRHDASSERSHSIKCGGDNTVIEGNISYNGLESGGGTDVIVRDNEILGSDGFGSTLVVGKFGARNVQSYNNYILCAAATFTHCLTVGGAAGDGNHFDESTDIECYNCISYNNVIESALATGTQYVGFRGCKDCLIAYNTIVGPAIRMSLEDGGGTGAYAPNNPTFYNNTWTATGLCLEAFTNYTGTLTTDYNNFFTCTPPPSQTHAITGNPRLLADFTIDPAQSSPLRDSALTVTTWPAYGGGTITLDLTTAPTWHLGSFTRRPSGAGPDVGAFEVAGCRGALQLLGVGGC